MTIDIVTRDTVSCEPVEKKHNSLSIRQLRRSGSSWGIIPIIRHLDTFCFVFEVVDWVAFRHHHCQRLCAKIFHSAPGSAALSVADDVLCAARRPEYSNEEARDGPTAGESKQF